MSSFGRNLAGNTRDLETVGLMLCFSSHLSGHPPI
jgi:hypothetical protein